VKGDRTRELEEVFYVNLSGATAAVIQSGQGTSVVRNDDRLGGNLGRRTRSAGTLPLRKSRISLNPWLRSRAKWVWNDD
jgi:hypothetical protein